MNIGKLLRKIATIVLPMLRDAIAKKLAKKRLEKTVE